MKGHLKHMLIAGAAILVVLLLSGVNVRDALPWAALLACPLMMVGMMVMMSRGMGPGGGSHHEHGPHCGTGADATGTTRDDHGTAVPPAQERHVAR